MRVVLGLIAATCAAPVGVAVAFAVAFYLQTGWFAGQPWSVVEENIRLYALFSGPVAFFVAVSAGAPFSHQLADQGHRGLIGHAIIGLLLGASPFAAFDGYIIGSRYLLDARPAPDMDTILTALRWAGLGAWCGLCSAVTYWAIAIRRSGPKTQPKT